ncbi:GNAT family N-acetyltransferase [Oceanicoccus sp. KOV_DT_Chl]|uniref:GNAT family N-acetyltransferase n=1 Tax=Oceanicoccus sp. KOV_DT_Chl TaxID=1904639 RepID=UPI000C7AF009|nr:GNAT family N-acetyltransferase [Oceanicoccus sp. KOV_DT_Chl]
MLVDEAAAIPAAMLEAMLRHYNRVVFATTVHGYEGTGRGFDIRFKQTLTELRPQWKALELNQPIRWAQDDPLEQFLFEALLLNAQAVPLTALAGLVPQRCVIEPINRDDLLTDHQSLNELFGLLVQAHYQTTPNDLRNLLDGPNISIWVSRFRGHIVAAALLAREGGFEEALSQAVYQGARRPRGHLLAQSLSVHAGFPQAAQMTYQRVMRIAVHPQAQRQGIGRQLLNAMIDHTRNAGVDFIGSSFSATADVLAFWHSVGCVPVRLGVSRDASSGCHSALVLSALSEDAQSMLLNLRDRFGKQFPLLLARGFNTVDFTVVEQLLRGLDSGMVLDQQDWMDVEAFAKGYRQYDMCLPALLKLLCVSIVGEGWGVNLSTLQRRILIECVLQGRTLDQLVRSLQLSGKRAVLEELRAAIGSLWSQLITA